MSLSSHLREFRVRLSWSAGFVIAGNSGGLVFYSIRSSRSYKDHFLDVTRERGIDAIVNFGTVVFSVRPSHPNLNFLRRSHDRAGMALETYGPLCLRV